MALPRSGRRIMGFLGGVAPPKAPAAAVRAMKEEEAEERPLPTRVRASAAGAMKIDDTEPPSRHCCIALPEEGAAASGGADRHTAGPPHIPGPDSLATVVASRAQGSIPWRQRLRDGFRTLHRYRPVLLLATFVTVLLAAGSYAVVAYRAELLEAGSYIRRHAPLSAVYYALIVALWIIMCLPSTIIEVAAGLFYSYPVAIVCLTVGKQLGCGLAFLIGRWVAAPPDLRPAASCLPLCGARDHEQQQEKEKAAEETGETMPPNGASQRSRTIRAMFLALEHHPWQITFLIRLLPIPISIKNYGMACIKCPFHVFMATTLLAGLPFTVAWVYMGESCRSLLEALQGNSGEGGLRHRGPFAEEVGFLVLGLVIAIALALLLRRYTRRYSRLLAEREEASVAAAAAAAAAAAEEATKKAAAEEEEGRPPVHGGGERDMSTASSTTSTTALTLTPPSAARAMVLALMGDGQEEEEDEMEEVEL